MVLLSTCGLPSTSLAKPMRPVCRTKSSPWHNTRNVLSNWLDTPSPCACLSSHPFCVSFVLDFSDHRLKPSPLSLSTQFRVYGLPWCCWHSSSFTTMYTTCFFLYPTNFGGEVGCLIGPNACGCSAHPGPARETTSSKLSSSQCSQSSHRRSGFQPPTVLRVSHQVDPASRCKSSHADRVPPEAQDPRAENASPFRADADMLVLRPQHVFILHLLQKAEN